MTAPTFPMHVIPLPGSAITGSKHNLTPGMLYRFTDDDRLNSLDDSGRSWLDRLGETDQVARWGAVRLQVVEDHVARPGAALVQLRATADVPLQGSGRLAAGQSIVLTEDLMRQLTWLAPGIQVAVYGHVVLAIEPVTEGV